MLMKPVTDSVLIIIFLYVTAFILELLSGFLFRTPIAKLGLHFGQDFHPTQILTHIFLTGESGLAGILNIFFQMLIFLGFATDIERIWGSVHFLKLFFTGIIGGLITWLLTCTGMYYAGLPSASIIYGYGGALAAILIAYAVLWPNREALFFFVLPLKMKWIIFIFLILFIITGGFAQRLQFTGGALFGFLFMLFYARKGQGYKGPISTRSSSQGKVMEDSPGMITKIKEYFRKRRLKKKQEVINQRIKMKEEVDLLLDKISKHGMDSLSRKEKAFLDKASKEL